VCYPFAEREEFPSKAGKWRSTMPSFEEYANNLNLALIEATENPVFLHFMEPDDIETVAYDLGNGLQAQEQALARASVQRVIERIFKWAQDAGVNLHHLICSKDKFNLCAKLNLPPGELMRQLHDFLANEFVAAGLLIAGAAITAPIWAHFLLILSAIGIGFGVLAKICGCEPPPKNRPAAEPSPA
jgi:hypothetical protein